MNDLPLQVGQVDMVIVGQQQATDAGASQIQRRRATQPAHADDQYAAVEQALLTIHINLLQQYLAAVTQQLLIIHPNTLHLPAADHPGHARPVLG